MPKQREMINKASSLFLSKVDADAGVVTALCSVMGVIDHGDDIIHNGAYTKTLVERGPSKLRVLDNHRTDSTLSAVAKVLAAREIGRFDLPEQLKAQYPEATGALEVTMQFMLDDPTSRAIFCRVRDSSVSEYSIGFQIVQSDFSRVKNREGKEIVIRNIREIRLFEVSPVLFGMNSQTQTTDVKADDSPAPDEDKEYGPDGPQQRLGDQLAATMHSTFIQIVSGYLRDGMVDGDEYKRMCECGDALLLIMKTMLPEDLRLRPMPDMFSWLFFGADVPDELKATAIPLHKINPTVNEPLTENEDGASMESEEQPTSDSPSADLAGPLNIRGALSAPTKSDDELRAKLALFDIELVEVEHHDRSNR